MITNRKRAVAVAVHRAGLLAAALLALACLMALLAMKPAAAGNGYDPKYRFCLSSVGGPFMDMPDCAFNTWEQCQYSAHGRGYCVENPGYTGRPRRSHR